MKLQLHDLPRLWAHRDVRLGVYVLAGILVVAIAAWIIVSLRRPSAEEIERRRRAMLSERGRITDGVLDDARTLRGEEAPTDAPEVLIYSYELAGVTYQCAQDVSGLRDRIGNVTLDQPVQVRYEPRNPGNSVLVTETWTGLRFR